MKRNYTGLKKATAFALVLGITMQFTACGGAEEKEENSEVVEITVTPTAEPTEAVTNTPIPEPTEAVGGSMTEDDIDMSDDPYTQQLIKAEEEANKADESLNTSEGVEIVEELDIDLYVQKSCNARKGDGVNFDKVTQLEVGAKPHITGRTANDWYRIQWGDGVVYASSQFFGETDPLANSTSNSQGGGSDNSQSDVGASSESSPTLPPEIQEALGGGNDGPVQYGGAVDDPNSTSGLKYSGEW